MNREIKIPFKVRIKNLLLSLLYSGISCLVIYLVITMVLFLTNTDNETKGLVQIGSIFFILQILLLGGVFPFLFCNALNKKYLKSQTKNI